MTSLAILPRFIEDEQLTEDNSFVASRTNVRKRKTFSKTQKSSTRQIGDPNVINEKTLHGLVPEQLRLQHFSTVPSEIKRERASYPSPNPNVHPGSSSVMMQSSVRVGPSDGLSATRVVPVRDLPDSSTLPTDRQLNNSGGVHMLPQILQPISEIDRHRGNNSISSNSPYSDDEPPSSKQFKHDDGNYNNVFDHSLLYPTSFLSQPPPVRGGSDDLKKQKNREAATRCRSRKHERIRRLEEKSRELLEENDKLERTVWTLKRERDGIREAFMYHLTNDCHGEFHRNF